MPMELMDRQLARSLVLKERLSALSLVSLCPLGCGGWQQLRAQLRVKAENTSNTKQNKITLRVVMASPDPLAICAIPAPRKAD